MLRDSEAWEVACGDPTDRQAPQWEQGPSATQPSHGSGWSAVRLPENGYDLHAPVWMGTQGQSWNIVGPLDRPRTS